MTSARSASSSASPSSISPRLMKHKDDTVGANVQGVAFLLKKNKVDAFFGTGSIPRRRQGRSDRRGRLETGSRDQEHRHRHRLGRRAAARRDHRRKDRGLLDRRAGAVQGSGEDDRGRRRRDRPRTRLGLAPSRRGGHGRRISRPHPARHGRRDRQAVPAPAGKAGRQVRARLEGDQGRDQPRAPPR